MEPLGLAAVEAGFDVTFFVTGMHMLEKYGLTKIEVQRSGAFKVVEYINQRSGDPQDIILAKTVTGFSDVCQEFKPDMVVIHGDRVEALACALVCVSWPPKTVPVFVDQWSGKEWHGNGIRMRTH